MTAAHDRARACLRMWLEEAGCSRERAARAVGVTRQALGLVLAGRCLPSLPTAVAIDRMTEGRVSVYSWIEED